MDKESTKNSILTCALKLFSSEGYKGVTVDQIAKAVGIKAPSLYKHYNGKRDIFDSIVRRMQERDAAKAQRAQMPETASVEDETTPSLALIKTYSLEMFRYWTEEEFSSDFRKMLTLEQYRNEEMAQLYRMYLSSGPTEYMTAVFTRLFGADEAEQLALEFYAPMHLLYSVYDTSEDKTAAVKLLEKHIDRFTARTKTRIE